MALPKLHPERLLVIVFGPGVGELILVHAPPGEWMVIDGCRRQASAWYAQRALKEYAARPSLIVLTHPHRDHAGGVAALVEQLTPEGDETSWPLLGMVEPPDLRGSGDVADPGAAFDGGLAEQAVATITDRWERHPACKWDMPEGDVRSLGHAQLTVLSPEDELRAAARARAAAGQSTDPNRLASAVLLEWADVRIVLGSDLEPSRSWVPPLIRAPHAASHLAIKVPHHGSEPALHAPLFASSPSAIRIVTPYASQNLPRFTADGGIAWLHGSGHDVHLSALPRSHAQQGGTGGQRFRRVDLEPDGRHVTRDPRTQGFPDCFVAVEWTSSAVYAVHHGPGSLIVEP